MAACFMFIKLQLYEQSSQVQESRQIGALETIGFEGFYEQKKPPTESERGRELPTWPALTFLAGIVSQRKTGPGFRRIQVTTASPDRKSKLRRHKCFGNISSGSINVYLGTPFLVVFRHCRAPCARTAD